MDGIDNSNVFLCCLSTYYCKGENTLKEFYYAKEAKKQIVYVLMDDIDREERIKMLKPVLFHMRDVLFHKYKNGHDGIVAEIKKIIEVIFQY